MQGTRRAQLRGSSTSVIQSAIPSSSSTSTSSRVRPERTSTLKAWSACWTVNRTAAEPRTGHHLRHSSMLGKLVPRPLYEQHGDVDTRQVVCSLTRRFLRRVQRKTKESQASHMRHRRDGLRLRRHPPTERLSTREQRQARRLICCQACCPDCTVCNGRRIRPLGPALDVRKLITQGGHLALGQSVRNFLHEGVRHPRPGAMRKYKTSHGGFRQAQQGRDGALDVNGDAHWHVMEGRLGVAHKELRSVEVAPSRGLEVASQRFGEEVIQPSLRRQRAGGGAGVETLHQAEVGAVGHTHGDAQKNSSKASKSLICINACKTTGVENRDAAARALPHPRGSVEAR